MADEQSLGMPAGSGDPGGRRPQVAAGFKVDSSSLQQLHQTWQLLIKDVQTFSKELNKIPTKNLDKISQALGRPATGSSAGGGSASGSYIKTPQPAGSSQQPGVQESRGRGSRFKNSDGTVNWSKATGAAATAVGGAALFGMGSYMQSHLQNIANIDTLFTQTLGASAGSYTGAPGKNALYNTVFGRTGNPGSGIGGYTSAQDFGQGYSALQSTFGPGFANTSAGRSMLTQVGAMGNLPGNNFTNSGDLTSQLYSPQMFWALQRLGVFTTKPGGAKVPETQIINQIISRVYGGKNVNAGQISSGLAAGAPLQVTLSGLGFSSNAIQQIGQYAMANAQSGGGLNLAGGTVANTAANRAAGVTTGQSIQQSMNVAGRASTNLEQQTGNQSRGAIEGYFQAFGHAVDSFSKAVNALVPGGLGTFGAAGMLASPIGGLMSGPLGNIMQLVMFEKLLGGGGLFGGGGAAATSLFSKGGMSALLQGGAGAGALALGQRALGGAAIAGLGVTAVNAGQSLVNKHTKPGSGLRTLSNIASDAGRGAAIGAGIGAIGLPLPVVGEITTAGGAAIGGIAGGLYGAGRALFGDSGGNSNPWAQTGPTIDQIIAMGKPTGAVITSTYRPGGGSYHAAHEAVDFGWPGNDPNHLLAIDHFWASKYGSELAELIYTGPGGITMKNGKVIPPDQWNSFWGSAVVEEHKNHVHVAATPQSLRGHGGGVSVGAGGSSSSSSSSGSAKTASSGSFSAANPFSSNFGSVDAATAYAGLMGGGVVSAGMGGKSASSSGTAHKTSSSSTSTTANVSGSVQDWASQGLKLAGKPASWLAGMVALAMHESGGKNIPQTVNDINMRNGTPAFGPWQMIQGTFNSYAVKGHTNWKNPIDEAAAAANYVAADYGNPNNTPGLKSLATGGGYKGYAAGAWQLPADEHGVSVHRGEMIIPAAPANAIRKYVSKRKQQESAAPNLSGRVHTGSGNGNVTVTISAPIHMPSGTTAADAKAFLSHVKQAAAEDEMFASLGAGD